PSRPRWTSPWPWTRRPAGPTAMAANGSVLRARLDTRPKAQPGRALLAPSASSPRPALSRSSRSAQVGLAHVLAGADLVGGAGHQRAAEVQNVDPVADGENQAHVVFNHQNAQIAPADEVSQQLAEGLALGMVE